MANGSGNGGKSGSRSGGGQNGGVASKGWAGRTSTNPGKVSGGHRSPAPGVPGHGKAPA